MKRRIVSVLIALLSAACVVLLVLVLIPAVRSALPRPWTAVSFAPAPDTPPTL
ncbi:MAG TPA: hypothetical protein GX722_00150, partial [Clostridiales bacterium]|nr:hypothetical protein [Clostridiales bacterium]